jgi:hypothetical protein
MPSPADFAGFFDDCRTMRDSHEAYKEAIRVLQEAHRLCMARLVAQRDSPTSKVRTAPGASQDGLRPDLAVKRSRDALIRNWAAKEGISFQRVNRGLRALYDEAHPDESPA